MVPAKHGHAPLFPGKRDANSLQTVFRVRGARVCDHTVAVPLLFTHGAMVAQCTDRLVSLARQEHVLSVVCRHSSDSVLICRVAIAAAEIPGFEPEALEN